ncbi:glycosyltransferase family 2 protein [Microbacterium rhizophilus]|uniref:glycosyltransferase family 2 protein n=1 Tax=Microbacterium rhizophilus TaxID=3138934 RepID=UPI0031ECFA5A
MRISVVIPVRDDALLLGACLAALAAQTRAPDEVIVVDNGSSDDSGALATAAGARVVTEPIRGIPRAAAAGYDAAAGDVIARIDADSVCPPDWLARVETAFAEDPDLDFLTGDGRFYGAGPLVRWVAEHWYIGLMYAVLTPVLGHSPLFGSNLAMRAGAWHELSPEVHREATDIHDDFDLSLHVRPWMTVRHDRGLVVGVSARPFENWPALRRRLSWVIPTLRLHWPRRRPDRGSPPRRRQRPAPTSTPLDAPGRVPD